MARDYQSCHIYTSLRINFLKKSLIASTYEFHVKRVFIWIYEFYMRFTSNEFFSVCQNYINIKNFFMWKWCGCSFNLNFIWKKSCKMHHWLCIPPLKKKSHLCLNSNRMHGNRNMIARTQINKVMIHHLPLVQELHHWPVLLSEPPLDSHGCQRN